VDIQQEQATTLDAEAYRLAIQLQEDRQLGTTFAHRCLTVAIWLAAALLVSLVVNGGLAWKVAHPPVKYFATENGEVIPIEPQDKPAFSQEDVAAFGATTLRKSFNLDFVHYKNQMSEVGDRYSEEGYKGYYTALTASNLWTSVKDQRMNLSVDVGPGVIRSKGLLGDVYTWEFQYPVTLKLDGQQTGAPAQRMIFTVRIQRPDVNKKPRGLEVTQLISTGA
jgi:intracellular multiplication protein IcmL